MIRTKCVECFEAHSFEELKTFENFPVYMGISETVDNQHDLRANMCWVICKNCGCIQLETLIDPNVLYQRSHNPSIGKTWEQHHKDFADYVTKNMTGSSLLEIGGSNLILYGNIDKIKNIENYIIYDKHSYKECKNTNLNFVNEYFSHDSKCDFKFENIINSHTFEHFYDPMFYLNNFNKLLNSGQKLIMSMPNISNMIKDGLTNALNFEHTYWIDEDNLTRMLNENGFNVDNITNYNEYNIFVSATKTTNPTSSEIKPLKYQINKKTFLNNFIRKNTNEMRKINEKFDAHNGEKYIFGCHVFTQYFISFGLNETNINGILDNDPNKIGHRLYGVNLKTFSPSELVNCKNPMVFLRAGIYTKEIKQQILSINKETKFI